MKKLLFALLSSIVLMSCNDNVNTPEDQSGADDGSLKKTIYLTYESDFPLQSLGNRPNLPDYSWPEDDYSFTFNTINFRLVETFDGNNTGTISIRINDVQYATYTYSPTSTNTEEDMMESYWTEFTNFNYNGYTISMKFYIERWVPTMPFAYEYDYWPSKVFVQIPAKALDAPTGFSVTPADHDNLSQQVTVSWTPSTDTDVTGYQIYRSVDGSTSFTLVQTITSRTTGSWVNTGLNWTPAGSHKWKLYEYKVRAINSSLNLYSDFAAAAGSMYRLAL